jgi:hypothetical protein
VTNKCDQPEKGEQEGEGVLQQQKTGQLSHSPAAKESVVNLVARIAELEKELAEARANNNKPEVDEEEEMKKKFQVILSNARNRELGRMQQSEAMFVLQGQLATSLSMVSSAHL